MDFPHDQDGIDGPLYAAAKAARGQMDRAAREEYGEPAWLLADNAQAKKDARVPFLLLCAVATVALGVWWLV